MSGPSDSVGPGVDARKDAWRHTLREMEEIGEELTREGWDVVSIPVGHTAPQPPDVGDDDRFGLIAVVPGNHRDAFESAFSAGGFDRYDALRQVVSGNVFCLLQLLDPPTETAILLALQFSTADAEGLATAVRERGVVYTHVQTLDGEHLGSFEHDRPEKLLPSLEGE